MKADPDVRQYAKKLRGDMTQAEIILWSRLRRRQLDGWQFRRQLPIGRFIVDFACPQAKVAVEVDGATHSSDREQAYDAERQKLIETQGWTVLRVSNTDVYENLDGVLQTVLEALFNASTGNPPPRSGGGGAGAPAPVTEGGLHTHNNSPGKEAQ